MRYIERFRQSPGNKHPLVADPAGYFVRFDDHLTECQSLTRSRDNLKTIVNQIALLVSHDQKKGTLADAVRRAISKKKP